MSVSESKAKALAVASAILDKKATDVLILHIAKLTSVADYLVIGRPIRDAQDPPAATAAILEEMQAAFDRQGR